MIDKLWHRSTRQHQNLAMQEGLLTVVDIGSSKISCAVLQCVPETGIRKRPSRKHQLLKWYIIGHSVNVSHGVEGGMIQNPAEMENCLRSALSKLFRMSRNVAKYVVVGYSGPIVRSSHSVASCLLSAPVTNRDISRAIANSKQDYDSKQEFILHEHPINLKIDGMPIPGNPIGRKGRRVVFDLHQVTARRQVIDRILAVMNRCGLLVAGLHISQLASGMSTLVETEISGNALIVDIGSATTNIAAFSKRNMIWSTTLDMGGDDFTNEISNTFGVNREEAERIKVLHGNSMAIPSDMQDNLTFIGGKDYKPSEITISRATLHDFLEFRLGELIEGIAGSLQRLGWTGDQQVSIVLTGGGSKLAGIADCVQFRLGNTVRVGMPVRIAGMPSAMHNEQCSTLVGLTLLGISPPKESWDYPHILNFGMGIEGGVFSRTTKWLVANW